jgi:hypothetical protein
VSFLCCSCEQSEAAVGIQRCIANSSAAHSAVLPTDDILIPLRVDRARQFLRNSRNYLPSYTASHPIIEPRKPQTSRYSIGSKVGTCGYFISLKEGKCFTNPTKVSVHTEIRTGGLLCTCHQISVAFLICTSLSTYPILFLH